VLQATPLLSVPVLLLPEASATEVPLPSLKPYAATRPVVCASALGGQDDKTSAATAAELAQRVSWRIARVLKVDVLARSLARMSGEGLPHRTVVLLVGLHRAALLEAKSRLHGRLNIPSRAKAE
jgi:hypothetical protein